MKTTISCHHLRLTFEKSRAGADAIFITPWGDSYGAITSKSEAKKFAKYLRKAADWVESVADKVATK